MTPADLPRGVILPRVDPRARELMGWAGRMSDVMRYGLADQPM
jgi:hypothetical protein